MACHEIGALRLGMMELLGIDDDSARQHEISELGDALNSSGTLKTLSSAKNLSELKYAFEASLSELEKKVSGLSPDDPKLSYWRALIILTKKVEFDLNRQLTALDGFWRDLDEMHDFVHEVYPA